MYTYQQLYYERVILLFFTIPALMLKFRQVEGSLTVHLPHEIK